MITTSEKHFIDTLAAHGRKNNISEKQTLLAVGLYAKSVGASEYLMNYLKDHPNCNTDEMFQFLEKYCLDNGIESE